MRWVKQGLIVSPNAQAPWVGTHAALPVVSPLNGRQRIYFSSRDARNRAHIGHVTLSLSNRDEPQEFSPSAILSPGAVGTFDDAGVTSSCLVEHAGRHLPVLHGMGARRERPLLPPCRRRGQRRRRRELQAPVGGSAPGANRCRSVSHSIALGPD